MMAIRIGLAGMALLLGAATVQAQNVNLRGTIEAFDGKVVTVKTREGLTVPVELPEAIPVAITRPFSLADVTPGMVLGVTTVKRADGTVVAIDLRPIPATANQGLSPWDLQPDATMTNAAVEGAAQAPNGNEITLNYKSGTVKVLVLPTTAMSRSSPGTRDDIKPGVAVFSVARREAGDRLVAVRLQVGKDGVAPTQ